jgi:cytochrome c oxidase subunit 1
LSEPIGKLHFWLTIIGANLTFFPMHFIGLLGMPRRIYTYDAALGLDTMNLLATIGAFITGISALVFVFNVLWSRTRGTPVEQNPWGAATLEWSISSPPPVYNFSVIPDVRSRLPLWSEKGMSEVPVTPPEPVHVPGGSFWPLVAAIGIVVAATGAILKTVLVAVAGAAVLVLALYAWAFEPFEV